MKIVFLRKNIVRMIILKCPKNAWWKIMLFLTLAYLTGAGSTPAAECSNPFSCFYRPINRAFNKCYCSLKVACKTHSSKPTKNIVSNTNFIFYVDVMLLTIFPLHTTAAARSHNFSRFMVIVTRRDRITVDVDPRATCNVTHCNYLLLLDSCRSLDAS